MDRLSSEDRRALVSIARQSITEKLAGRWTSDPIASTHSAALREPRSAFVSLHVDGDLRGCCGSLDASRPLYVDVWRNAVAAAFGDPRFAALSQDEWPRAQVHISALSVPEPLQVENEAALLSALRPNVDGLVLELRQAVPSSSNYVPPGRATFLPAVWEQLPDPQSFVQQLKSKAGWPSDFWSNDIQVSRYVAEEFGDDDL